MNLKLLIVTQYFPPETGAPQNRLFELAVRLKKQGVDITVLTAMPNYPKGEIFETYKGKKYYYEEMDGLKVHRTGIYATKSKKIIPRLRNYFSFVWTSFKAKNKLEKHYDYVLCESPPLFLGISAYLISRKKQAKFIFNVSDLWPESAEKLGLVTNKFFLKLATWLEEWLYRKSDLITGQTQGIVKNISTRFPNKKVYWLPNGVDVELFRPENIADSDFRKKNGFAASDILFLYAGIIGHAQGLEVILKAAKELRAYQHIKFLLLGEGPVKAELQNLQEKWQLDNVIFLDIVPKSKIPEIVKAIDVAVIPLKRLDLFKGAIPSKIFENLAMQKPILLGVEGEAKQLFIDEGNAGLFFEPENAKDLAGKALYLAENKSERELFGKNGRKYVMEKFNRDSIAMKFYREISRK